jgi:hypothetical protein
MKTTLSLTLLAFALATAAMPDGSDSPSRPFHLTKNCATPNPPAGVSPYCTVTFASLPQIKAGSNVYYNLPATSAPVLSLDSMVVLYVSANDWATGRCTLKSDGAHGLCTFTDGYGTLAGFHARVLVTPDATNPSLYHWDGSYSLDIEP